MRDWDELRAELVAAGLVDEEAVAANRDRLEQAIRETAAEPAGGPQGRRPLLVPRPDGQVMIVCLTCRKVYDTVRPDGGDWALFWSDPNVRLICAEQGGDPPECVRNAQERFQAAIPHWAVRPAADPGEESPAGGSRV